MILIYFSVDLGITSMLIFSKLFSSLMMKWLSYPFELWKMIDTFFGIVNFELQFLCAAPLYLPVMWQWSLALCSFISFEHIQQVSVVLYLSSSACVVISSLLKWSLIILLHSMFTLKTHCKNSLIQLLP